MTPDQEAIIAAPSIGITRADAATKKRAKAIAKSIDGVKRDAQKIQQVSRYEIEEVAEKYSRSPSTFLAAVLGGAIGSAGGVALGSIWGGVLIATGPIGLVIGAAAGVLAFRGRNYWRLEKATQKAKGALDFVRTEINALPPDAPQGVRDRLYYQYSDLMTEYSRVARGSIDDHTSDEHLLPGPPP